MTRAILLDTGVLIAYLMPNDKFHAWAVAQFSQISVPVLTNESVITEACFLAQRIHRGQETILQLVQKGHITLSFNLSQDITAIAILMQRYASVPISLADAGLVRMSELYDDSPILTLDSDFTIYRRHRNQPIPVIMPSDF